MTFLVAFGLRREAAATWWFGFLLGALTAGALVGVLLVARARRFLSEQQMLSAALWWVAAVAGLGALFPSRLMQALWPSLLAWPVRWPSHRSTHSCSATSARRTKDGPSLVSRPSSSSCGCVGAFAARSCSRSPFAGGDAVMAIAAAAGAPSPT